MGFLHTYSVDRRALVFDLMEPQRPIVDRKVLEFVQAGRTLFDDCLFHRLQPGEGGLPVNYLLEILKEIGGLQKVGPEVFSASLDKMSADAIVETLRAPYWGALATAGISA